MKTTPAAVLIPQVRWPGSCAALPALRHAKAHSAKAEALCALMQRQHQAVLKDLLALVLDHVQLVEAGVGCRQALLRPVRLVDLEALRAPNALQQTSDMPQQTAQL